MLTITIESRQLYDEKNDLFSNSPEVTIVLEHSLVSISKWESKWCKPFLVKGNKTREENLDYIRFMTITQNVDHNIYNLLSKRNQELIAEYIDAPMTATTIPEIKSSGKKQIVTSELIYYWMISFNIPVEFQKWHLNRLLTLINVFNIKNQPKKKRSKKEIMAEQKALNEARRAQLKSKG